MSVSWRGRVAAGGAAFFGGLLLTGSAAAGTLMWNFAQGDLSLAAAQGASATMSYFNAATADRTHFGVTGVGGVPWGGQAPPDMADGPASYLYHERFESGGRGGYLIDHTGLTPAPGEDRLRDWTMVFDVFAPGELDWNGMFNSDPAQTGAAEWYLYPSGAIGSTDLHLTGPGILAPGAWHRIGLVYDGTRNKAEYWIDGQEVFDGPIQVGEPYTLLSSAHAGADLVLQGDGCSGGLHENFTSPLYLASFAMADFACLDYQMKALGGPQAAGILLPSQPAELAAVTPLAAPAGLDLCGMFEYAINVGANAGEDRQIGPVTFVTDFDAVAGYTSDLEASSYQNNPDFGSGPFMAEFEGLLRTYAWDNPSKGGASGQAALTLEVAPGEDYKLQLLFYASDINTSFDVSVEGVEILDEFRPKRSDGAAQLLTYYVTAESDLLEILFTAGEDPEMPCHTPVLSALTLERLSVVPGDANDDGVVDAEDAAILAAHWLDRWGVGWREGDFNGDGRVDDLDASILAANWQTSPLVVPLVPEPHAIALAVSLAVGLGMRRRGKRSRRCGA